MVRTGAALRKHSERALCVGIGWCKPHCAQASAKLQINVYTTMQSGYGPTEQSDLFMVIVFWRQFGAADLVLTYIFLMYFGVLGFSLLLWACTCDAWRYWGLLGAACEWAGSRSFRMPLLVEETWGYLFHQSVCGTPS